MTAHALPRHHATRRPRGLLMLPMTFLGLLVAGAGIFVAFALWPTWPGAPIPLDAPAIPITVAGVLFDVPPAAIRATVQRHAGTQERIDLAFLWPSLTPPADVKVPDQPAAELANDGAAAPDSKVRLFVTIAALGAVLPPADRLRSIYPRYVEATASAGADGLAIVPFRADSPYQGEDLVYVAAAPERFFARCTRQAGIVAGNCIVDRSIGGAVVTLRFARDWLKDWGAVAAGFDQLMAELRSQ